MPDHEILYEQSVAVRKLPVNFAPPDFALFKHELERKIPATALLHLENIIINSEGILFDKGRVLPETFASPKYVYPETAFKTRLKLFVKNRLFRNVETIEQKAFWMTDNWSLGYSHWMIDALPRLFAVRDKLSGAILLLPGAYEKENFILPSLKPLFARNVKFIRQTVRCKNLLLPTQTAPTGNYNERIMCGLRDTFQNFYRDVAVEEIGERIYISRSKARWSKIVNEKEVCAILKEFGFETVYFEDYSFDQKVKIASKARHLISNHGGGLTNMLFIKSGGSVLELRRRNDSHNNCYFSLTSALDLKYFYQICDTQNLDEQANTADLIVDCKVLRKNIEQMTAMG